MSRVLIWKNVSEGNEYDIFGSINYNNLYEYIQKIGGCPNQGNKLWFQGLFSTINTGENEYVFLEKTIEIEKINSCYDFVLLPMANIFNKDFLHWMKLLTLTMEKIKIPVYVVVCGVQADNYDMLDDIIKSIGEESTRFIRAVYNTGGEFALRGYFTKEFFDRLGFKSAVVTGGPSLFQLGSNFRVDDKKVKKMN